MGKNVINTIYTNMKTFQQLKTELLLRAKRRNACVAGYDMGLATETKSDLAKTIMINWRWIMLEKKLIDEACLLEHFTIEELAKGGLYYGDNDVKKLSDFWTSSVQLDGYYTFEEAQSAAPEGFRLPTIKEFFILSANTVYTFDETTKEGIFTFKNDTALRIPASGYRSSGDGALYSVGNYGGYWSCSVSGASGAYNLSFYSDEVHPANFGNRANGRSVRYVKKYINY
jgi:uncharacterized protein (TIGR02145 family)